MFRRFSSPSVLLAGGDGDLLTKAHALSNAIQKIQYPHAIDELGVRPQDLLRGDVRRAETILRNTVRWGLGKLNMESLGREWTLRVSDTNVDEALVQYFPDSGVLEMQQRALDVFREVDMVVVGVHEILGHHAHETRVQRSDRTYYLSSRRNTQEGCAMRCENDLLVGPLERAGLEWKLFRVLRALEDIGHLSAWDLYPEGHRMPREYVKSYVRMYSGQAQHYVFVETDDYCPC